MNETPICQQDLDNLEKRLGERIELTNGRLFRMEREAERYAREQLTLLANYNTRLIHGYYEGEEELQAGEGKDEGPDEHEHRLAKMLDLRHTLVLQAKRNNNLVKRNIELENSCAELDEKFHASQKELEDTKIRCAFLEDSIDLHRARKMIIEFQDLMKMIQPIGWHETGAWVLESGASRKP